MALAGWLLIGPALAREELPVPPIPPADHPRYDTAPIPDDTLRAPVELDANSVRLAPSLYRQQKDFVPGLGYTPGSSFKEPDKTQLNKPAPSLDVRIRLP